MWIIFMAWLLVKLFLVCGSGGYEASLVIARSRRRRGNLKEKDVMLLRFARNEFLLKSFL